jgi:hypothetical protein
LPSAATSTLIKNQNQYPPRQSIAAPKCHINGQIVGVIELGAEYEKIMTAVAITNKTKPYMVRRCASLLLVLQNSEEVSTSLVAVLKAKEAFSPEPTVLVADFLAFTELLKKYFALFL